MFHIGPDRDILVRTDHDQLLHLNGWIVGVDRRRRVAHAVDATEVVARTKQRSRRVTYDAACGAYVRLHGVDAGDGLVASALWPPRVSTLKPGASRCRECHELTGKPRPSGYFPPPGAKVGA